MKNDKKEQVILPDAGFKAVQDRLVDAKDLVELRKAKQAERKKKPIPLADVKRDLAIR